MQPTDLDPIRERLECLELENRAMQVRLRRGRWAWLVTVGGLLILTALVWSPRSSVARPRDDGSNPFLRAGFTRLGDTLINFDHVTHVRLSNPDRPGGGLMIFFDGRKQYQQYVGPQAEQLVRWMAEVEEMPHSGNGAKIETRGARPATGLPEPDGD